MSLLLKIPLVIASLCRRCFLLLSFLPVVVNLPTVVAGGTPHCASHEPVTPYRPPIRTYLAPNFLNVDLGSRVNTLEVCDDGAHSVLEVADLDPYHGALHTQCAEIFVRLRSPRYAS